MKESDIRPAEIFAKYLKLSSADALTYFGEPAYRQPVPCPGCGGADASAAFVKAGFTYCQCPSCASLFVSPRPSAPALDAFYGDSPSATYWAEVFFPASVAARRELIFAPRVDRILQLLAERGHEPATVIDVGAGYGLFLDEFRKRSPKSQLLAIEPGAKLAVICRAAGFETLEVPVESASVWAGRGDLVVCFEVLEHVHSPDEFVKALSALVKPGGYLVLTTLGADGFDIQVLWADSKSVSPPHHLNFLSVAGFKQLFERAGFSDVVALTPGRLDVDIVINALKENPEAATDRFVRKLIASGAETRAAFQQFLADHQLSSHTWLLARR